MAKTKREYIIATFIISCCATIFSIVSIATENWVEGGIKSNILGVENAEINYGLFSGTLVQISLNIKRETKVTIACIFSENICGYSTADDESKRKTEIENILNDKSCTNDKKGLSRIDSLISKEIFDIENNAFGDYPFDIELFDSKNLTDTMKYLKIKKSDDSTTESTSTTEKIANNAKCDKNFINSGLWLTTTLFLSLSILMGAIISTLSVLNTAGNPVSPWLNIWGLYIWNGISSFVILITMILYGALYGQIITENVGIVDTLNGNYSNDEISLGYSYWLLFVPLLLYPININLFYLRQYLIEKEPQLNEDKIETADRDGMIFVY